MKVVSEVANLGNAGVFCESFGLMVDVCMARFWSEEQRVASGGRDEVLKRLREFLEERFGVEEGWNMKWVGVLCTARKGK